MPPRTLELVHLRASQISGCSVRVDGHARILKKLGETDERIIAVTTWQDAPYFSEERARAHNPGALALAASGAA